MGFYLPGIGEAIGGALRVQRQEELWNKAQGILKDESRPMAERLQMVGVAYPELANTEDFKERITQARLFDQDKREAAKFEQEQERAATVENFKGVISELDPQARLDVLRKNPDLAALAVPEEWKVLKAADKSQQERSQWLEGEAGKDRRAAMAAQATVQAQQLALEKEMRTGIASGAIDPQTGAVIPYADRQAAAADLAVATAERKAQGAAAIEEKTLQQKRAQVDSNIEAGIDAVIKDIETEGGVGWSGADFGKREALRKTLGLALAQRENPGRPPTDADVAVAMERVPDMTTFVSAKEATAALQTLKQTFRGFTPALPEGFVIE